jgi:hypothetical protein
MLPDFLPQIVSWSVLLYSLWAALSLGMAIRKQVLSSKTFLSGFIKFETYRTVILVKNLYSFTTLKLFLYGWRVDVGSITSTLTLRVVGDDGKKVSNLKVKYGHESHGTRTRKWPSWRGQVAVVNDTPALSSERAPHQETRNCHTVIKIWS